MDYDPCAAPYVAHRRLHRGVLRQLREGSRLASGSAVLEVGCGTGNYVRALAAGVACTACGLDLSAGMLTQARIHPERVHWVQGRAERTCFADQTFDLVFCVDVIHHLSDRDRFYREVRRILRPGGRVCTVTDSEEIIRRREVLTGYFPETVEVELARYPRLPHLEACMSAAGLAAAEVAVVEEPGTVTSAQPFRDKAFSSLHLIGEEAWRRGMERLERDLARGPIPVTVRYACVWGQAAAGTG